MRNIFGIFDNPENNEEKNLSEEERKSKIVEDGKLHLRKEELDIAKNRVRVGEVELSKEIIEEQKIVDVPLTHEEVIIERRAIDNEPSDLPVGAEETIHIPVSEERVEVGKHTVVTGEVAAFKREVEERKEINETLKREEVRLKKEGDPNIVSDDAGNYLH